MTAIQEQTTDEVEVFVDLVLGDDDLVRAEFDALIAAYWESPGEPPLDKLCPRDGGWASRRPPRWSRRPGPPRALVPPRRPHGRGRGPPLRRSG